MPDNFTPVNDLTVTDEMCKDPVIIAASYTHQILHVMYNPPARLVVPAVSEGMVALLAIRAMWGARPCRESGKPQ